MRRETSVHVCRWIPCALDLAVASEAGELQLTVAAAPRLRLPAQLASVCCLLDAGALRLQCTSVKLAA